jgi:1-acyl-sn-glycerol-3-phosphate acyltransferase
MILEILLIALASLVVLAIVFVALLPWIFQPLLRLILVPRYGFRVKGMENLPKSGSAILAINHVTWIDGLFTAAICHRRGYVLANAGFFSNKGLFWLAKRVGMIPVPFTGPKAQRAAIQAVQHAIDNGQAVVIFPEGQLTRNGMLGPFYRGLEVILKGRGHIPVVPIYLDNLWGSIWSFQGGRAFGKRPKGLRRQINAAFGPALTGPPSLFEIRLAIQDLSVDAVGLRNRPMPPLETLDFGLPHFEHELLGLITASATNYDRLGITQAGERAGTVGLPLPGVGIRIVDDGGKSLGPDGVGRIFARIPKHPDWTELDKRGKLDADGFLTIES